jgi:hypothetical protein
MAERVADDLFGSRPAAVTARTNALRTSTVCPCKTPTDGNSQGVPFGKVSMYSVRNVARSAEIGCVRAPAFAAGT